MINMIFYTRLNFLTHAILLNYPNSHLFKLLSHTLHLQTLQPPPPLAAPQVSNFNFLFTVV
jgi:hypothetical protein